MNFPFETNGKLMILGVPILKHFRVEYSTEYLITAFIPGSKYLLFARKINKEINFQHCIVM